MSYRQYTMSNTGISNNKRNKNDWSLNSFEIEDIKVQEFPQTTSIFIWFI